MCVDTYVKKTEMWYMCIYVSVYMCVCDTLMFLFFWRMPTSTDPVPFRTGISLKLLMDHRTFPLGSPAAYYFLQESSVQESQRHASFQFLKIVSSSSPQLLSRGTDRARSCLLVFPLLLMLIMSKWLSFCSFDEVLFGLCKEVMILHIMWDGPFCFLLHSWVLVTERLSRFWTPGTEWLSCVFLASHFIVFPDVSCFTCFLFVFPHPNVNFMEVAFFQVFSLLCF